MCDINAPTRVLKNAYRMQSSPAVASLPNLRARSVFTNGASNTATATSNTEMT
jgi:hypothetical protein